MATSSTGNEFEKAKAKAKTLIERAFFSIVSTNGLLADVLLAFKGRIIPDESCKTLCTDGIQIFYSPTFIVKQTLPKVRFGIRHELKHVIYRHIERRGNRNHNKWNRACDYWINADEQKNGEVLIPGALIDPAFFGMTPEQIYDLLPDEPEDVEDDPNSRHMRQPPSATEKSPVPHVVKRSLSTNRISEKLSQSEASELQALYPNSPGIPFREMMRDVIQESWNSQDFSMSKPNIRMMGSGFYFPSLKSNGFGDIALIRDTSMSIPDALLKNAQAAFVDLIDELKPQNSYVIDADHEVSNVQILQDSDEISSVIKGRRGTDFRAAFKWLENCEDANITVAVYVTDLECTLYPEKYPDYPVIWLVPEHYRLSSQSLQPPFGTVIYVPIDGAE